MVVYSSLQKTTNREKL